MTEHRDAEADATEDDFQLSRHDLNAIERAIVRDALRSAERWTR